jgi:hypothetical protein
MQQGGAITGAGAAIAILAAEHPVGRPWRGHRDVIFVWMLKSYKPSPRM